MKMNQNTDGFVNGGTLLTMISSLAGFITLERVYMATAVVGLLITILGYLDKHRAIQEARRHDDERMKLERELHQATKDYKTASSPTYQSSVMDWYDTTFFTRADPRLTCQ